jgi:hypothetical protein
MIATMPNSQNGQRVYPISMKSLVSDLSLKYSPSIIPTISNVITTSMNSGVFKAFTV